MEEKSTHQTQPELGFTLAVQSLGSKSSVHISGVVEGLSNDEQQFLDAIGAALQKWSEKRMDYNKGDIGFKRYYPFGRTSAAQVLYGKVLRLVSMVYAEKSKPVNEPIEDTYLDLIVFAGFAHAVEMGRSPDTSNPAPTPSTLMDEETVATPRGPRPLGQQD